MKLFRDQRILGLLFETMASFARSMKLDANSTRPTS